MKSELQKEIEIEYIPLPCFVTNLSFELIDANEHFWDFFGLNLLDLSLHLKDYLEDQKALSNSATTYGNLGSDIVFNVNGEKKILQAKGQKIIKEYYIFVGVDVTLVNLFEQNNEQQRAAQLETHRLMELNRMVSEIMQEIHKPLVVVNKHVQMIQQQVKSNKELAPVFEKIQRGILKIVKAVNTKLETTKFNQDEEPVTIELKKLVMDTLKGRVEMLRQKNIQVMTDFPGDIQLKVRVGQIKQLLWYLIDNSIDALESNEKKIIMIKAELEGKRNLSIYVRDSGDGILEQFHEQIFAPFYTTKSHGEHTGTGLAQAKEITQLHRGSIAYDTSVKNTSFKITLPLNM